MAIIHTWRAPDGVAYTVEIRPYTWQEWEALGHAKRVTCYDYFGFEWNGVYMVHRETGEVTGAGWEDFNLRVEAALAVKPTVAPIAPSNKWLWWVLGAIGIIVAFIMLKKKV